MAEKEVGKISNGKIYQWHDGQCPKAEDKEGFVKMINSLCSYCFKCGEINVKRELVKAGYWDGSDKYICSTCSKG